MIFDTHLHLVSLAKLSYPWLDDFAALRMNSAYESYSVVAQRVGISGVLHMEVDVAEHDIEPKQRWLKSLCQLGKV